MSWDENTGVEVRVVDARERRRYEAFAGDELAGYVTYTRPDRDDGRPAVVLEHAVVEPAHEGHGIGSAMVRLVLDDLRGQGATIRPDCPFVRAWIGRHPEYADLVG